MEGINCSILFVFYFPVYRFGSRAIEWEPRHCTIGNFTFLCHVGINYIARFVNGAMLGGSVLTTAWHVLRLRMGEVFRLRRVARNILKKQSRTADKGWPSSLGLGVGLITPHRKNFLLLRNVSKRFGSGLILWQDLSNGKRT
jgi:hypothetical protein